MKTRNGFVSNSSSSSFCIYGCRISEEKVDLTDENYLEELGLEVHSNEDRIYIGKSWKLIGDNETGAEFKKSVADALKKLYGNDINIGTIQEAWYNG